MHKPDGSHFAKVKREELDLNIEKWSNTLVRYVLDDKPFYLHLKACVVCLWRNVNSRNVKRIQTGNDESRSCFRPGSVTIQLDDAQEIQLEVEVECIPSICHKYLIWTRL